MTCSYLQQQHENQQILADIPYYYSLKIYSMASTSTTTNVNAPAATDRGRVAGGGRGYVPPNLDPEGWPSLINEQVSAAPAYSFLKGDVGAFNGKVKSSFPQFKESVLVHNKVALVLVTSPPLGGGPGKTDSVTLLHQFTPVTNPINVDAFTLLAVEGLRRVAPIVSVNEDEVCTPLKVSSRGLGGKIPNIKAFFQCEQTEEKIKELRSDGTADEDGGLDFDHLKEWKNHFWLHPKFVRLMGSGTKVKAFQLMKLVIAETKREVVGETIPDDGDDDEGIDYTDPRVDAIHDLIIWLWLAMHNKIQSYPLGPPDYDQGDAVGGQIDREAENILSRRKKSTDAAAENLGRMNLGTQGAGSGGQQNQTVNFQLPPEVNEVVAVVTRFADVMVERQLSDKNKKKLTYSMPEEYAKLFVLLSAADWEDVNPVLNDFTRKLLDDKSPVRAQQLISLQCKKDKILYSPISNCLLQFFSNGYVMDQVEYQPSGFTVFMWEPRKGGLQLKSKEDKEQEIRNRFGEDGLTDARISDLAKAKYYLPKDENELTKQLEATTILLDTLTRRRGIAGKGYGVILGILKDPEKLLAMQNLASKDSLFWVKLGHFADLVFQRFAKRLAHFVDHDGPIGAAEASLRGSMERVIEQTFIGLHYGMLTLPLFEEIKPNESKRLGLQSDEKPPAKKPRRGDREPASGTDAPEWHVTNPDPIPDGWKPPTPNLAEYFNITNPAHTEWAADWPKGTHQATGAQKMLCRRYNFLGRCSSARCHLAHVPNGRLPETTKTELTRRCRLAYGRS